MQEGEPLENALRRFKRKVQQEDIIKEVKRHSFYLKPGEKKRVKEALARQAESKEGPQRSGLAKLSKPGPIPSIALRLQGWASGVLLNFLCVFRFSPTLGTAQSPLSMPT